MDAWGNLNEPDLDHAGPDVDGGLEEEDLRPRGPVINGVAPAFTNDPAFTFNNHYEGLNYGIDYTGGLLLADCFISDLYVHMGFHPAWKFKTVIELVFESGLLARETDRSKQMAGIRKMNLRRKRVGPIFRMLWPRKESAGDWIERSFDRAYRL